MDLELMTLPELRKELASWENAPHPSNLGHLDCGQQDAACQYADDAIDCIRDEIARREKKIRRQADHTGICNCNSVIYPDEDGCGDCGCVW